MIIIAATIWFLLSIYTIYKTDHDYYWDKLFTILITTSIIALLYNGWEFYNPELNRTAVIIDLNPTYSMSLTISIIEGICITGPIAGIHSFIEYLKERRG